MYGVRKTISNSITDAQKYVKNFTVHRSICKAATQIMFDISEYNNNKKKKKKNIILATRAKIFLRSEA